MVLAHAMSDATTNAVESATPLKRDGGGRWLPTRSRSRSMRGNLNATRYPWRVYWRKRALRLEDRWVLALVGDCGDDLISDKGGEAGITAGERRLVELATAARVAWLLAMASPGEGAREEAPRFMATELRALQALGLERRAAPAPSLAEVLAARTVRVEPTPPDAA